MEEHLRKYRQYLVETEQKVSENYDKTVITLSSGALGVSFAFLRDVIGDGSIQSKPLLIVGWGLLTVSLAAVVLSLLFGTMAFRRAIRQVDTNEVYSSPVGGWPATITTLLHFCGVLFLVAGLVAIGAFLSLNL